MSSTHSGTYTRLLRFGSFEADLSSGELRKRGMRIRLREQSFEVLATLLVHAGQLVTREELRHQLWHDDIHVDFDKSLNTVVGRLRSVLGDSADRPRFIETLPKRGYRFIADVYASPVAEEGSSPRARLAVLPFVNLSSDAAQEYLADAVTEELITVLASMAPERLGVIARTTAMHYKGSHKDVARIGRELNVDYIVEGSVRCTDASAGAINVQLIQAPDQTHVFARSYDTRGIDIINTTARAAFDLAMQIGLTPAPQGSRANARVGTRPVKRHAPDPVAYKEFLYARSIDKGTAETLGKVRQHLENAIARDPEFAGAYDALAETYWYLGYFGFLRTRDAFAAGIFHALRALEIDDTRAETHALLGQFHKTSKYDWGAVRREMALARQLDPASPLVKLRYAVSELMPQGRIKEAIDELERTLELDPLSTYARPWLSLMLIFAGSYERAGREALRTLEVDPTHWGAYLAISACHRYRGNNQEAISAQRKCVELSGNAAGMLGWLGLTLAGCGETSEARAILRGLQKYAAKHYVPPSSFAWIHLGLREIDTAFDWLNRAVDECDQFMMPIKSYGFLHPIRTDPRFTVLLRKMNLAP